LVNYEIFLIVVPFMYCNFVTIRVL
jgi:hypothetical protein